MHSYNFFTYILNTEGASNKKRNSFKSYLTYILHLCTIVYLDPEKPRNI
jgi:hypothetical protein